MNAQYTPSSSATYQAHLLALQECDGSFPLGMISGEIEDWQISASSTYPQEWDKACHERYARLYQPNGRGWCAKYKTSSEWLLVDLGVAAKVTGVMTQGRGDGEEWVTSFMVSYSLDAFHWKYITDMYGNQKIFEGNVDSYSTKHTYLDEPVLSRFVKFHTVNWNKHPSLRVEIIGCQVCKSILTIPPSSRISASSEKPFNKGSSCRPEDGFLITNKAWCAKDNNLNQWLQFDIGPPTLVTGLITKGRGDGKRKQWVTRFRLSFSNDTQVWYYYKDATHLDPKEFGGNVDRDIERYHYLNSPFIARYVRFHPIEFFRQISMRAGLIGCPFRGKCPSGFMRVNQFTPCVENLSYKKESWINNRRQYKRHILNGWTHGHAARTVDGDDDQSLHSCTSLDNYYVDRPILRIDLGKVTTISGLMILTWQGVGQDARTNFRDYVYNLDRLDVFVDKNGGQSAGQPTVACGSITRLNDALFKPAIHVQCLQPIKGRFVYIEAFGVSNRWSRQFNAVLCEIMAYE